MSADQQRPHGSSDAERGSEEEPIVFNDRRRIDPETGEPRVSAESAAEQAEDGDALAQAERILDEAGAQAGTEAPQPAASDREAELETDLRRLQAEFVNYKRRVDRDRDLARDAGVVKAVTALLPVLDDIDAARAAGRPPPDRCTREEAPWPRRIGWTRTSTRPWGCPRTPPNRT